MPKGKILAEHAVTVEHRDGRVHVSWDGKVQYSTIQDGWTSEASAIREAATILLDTVGCWVEVQPQTSADYVMRLRVKD